MEGCRVAVFGDARRPGQVVRCIVALSALVLAPALFAQVRPRGIYAVVNVEGEINSQTKANPAITAAQLDAGFNSFYQDLLGNPAVAGLTLQVHWDTLNPNQGGENAYLWNYVDDAFNQAAAWNASST